MATGSYSPRARAGLRSDATVASTTLSLPAPKPMYASSRQCSRRSTWGYRTVIASDALCSSSDATHDALLTLMPTSPRSPLSFRMAGFPQYGWKDGISDGAFPTRRSAQACSRHTLATYWFASVLRASHFVSRMSRSVSGRLRADAPPWRVGNPPPQGSSLESGLCCPGLSSLNRPHPPHSQAHHDFAARRLIRNAFAVRERLGDPRVVPGFR